MINIFKLYRPKRKVINQFRRLFIIVIFLVITGIASASEGVDLYKEGMQFFEKGEKEIAYQKFNRVVKFFPRSKRAEEAQIKIIEYFNDNNSDSFTKIEIGRYFKLFPEGRKSHYVKEIQKGLELKEKEKKILEVRKVRESNEKEKQQFEKLFKNKIKKVNYNAVAERAGMSVEQLKQEYEEFWRKE